MEIVGNTQICANCRSVTVGNIGYFCTRYGLPCSPRFVCSNWQAHKSNFEKIAESEATLADFVISHDLHYYRHCPTDEMSAACQAEIVNYDDPCRKCWIEWLKREAGE